MIDGEPRDYRKGTGATEDASKIEYAVDIEVSPLPSRKAPPAVNRSMTGAKLPPALGSRARSTVISLLEPLDLPIIEWRSVPHVSSSSMCSKDGTMQKTHLNRAGYASLRRSTEPAGLLLLLKDALRSWLQIAVPTSLSAAEDATEAAVGLEDWPSLDIVYEEIRDSITAQNDRISAIDTKVNYGLVSGTLLTAGVTGLGRALVDAGQRTSAPSWNILGAAVSANLVVDWVTIASLGAYALLVVGVFSAYRLRTFKEAPNPQRLVTKYVYEDPRITKATITAVRAKNYASNEKAIERKVWWTNFTMVFLIVEALLLFVIAVIQVMWL